MVPKKRLFSIKRPGGRLALIMAIAVILPLLLAAPAAAWPLKMPTPTNLTASNIGYHEITINWQSSATGGFQVRCESGGSTVEFNVPGNTTSYECTSLNANTEYTFQVKALGGAIMDDSDYCSPITAKTKGLLAPVAKLGTPTNLQAIAASSSVVNLTWNDKSNGEECFVIERKTGSEAFQQVGTAAADAQNYSDSSGLAAGTEYTYRIYAKTPVLSYKKDSAYSNEAKATTQGTQQFQVIAPTNLSASAVSSSEINLSWTVNSKFESGFIVERKSGSGSFSAVKTLAAKTSSCSDSGLAAGTTYIYRVKAKGNGINLVDSNYSNEASATTISGNQTVLRFYIGSSEYYVNDQLNNMDAAALILEGRTMLPIAYAATPLGVAVDWNGPESKVTLSKQGTIIELWIDQSTARVNGAEVYIDSANPSVAPRIVGGRTMLPIGFIALNLNCGVDWNPNTQEVKVSYPK
ncbi:MAG: stalk domain-containing protein [Syntrophomonadaceae bacterium]